MSKIPGDAFALNRHRAGTEQQMPVNGVLSAGEIPRHNLSRHVQRNPAFQPQHHFAKGAVEVMHHIQAQSLFEDCRQSEHPFFGEFHILRQFLNWHIAADKYRLTRPGKRRGLEKIQRGLTEVLQPIACPGRRKLEGNGRHLQFVKADSANIVVQVKIVQLFQKGNNRVFLAGRTAQQPLCHLAGASAVFAERTLLHTHQMRKRSAFRRLCAPAGRKITHTLRKRGGIRGRALSRADTGQIGGVEIQRPRHIAGTQVKHIDEQIEIHCEPVSLFFVISQ